MKEPLATVVLSQPESAAQFTGILAELRQITCPAEVIAIDDGCDWNLAGEIARNGVKSVKCLDEVAPECGYVAILGENETFQTPYVLEIAVRTAMLKNADAVGGVRDSQEVSNFVYKCEKGKPFRLPAEESALRTAWLDRPICVGARKYPGDATWPTTSAIREKFLDIQTRLQNGEITESEAGKELALSGWHYFGEIFGPAARKNGMIAKFNALENLAAGGHFFTFGVDAACIQKTDVPQSITAAPLLSIIMPVFNVERYLARAIESIRSQTMPSWELICIDDGSRDRSPEILDAYAAADPRIRVIHKPNTCVSDTRNKGLAAVRGKYAAFIDGDDWFERDMAETVMRECLRRDLDYCLFDFRPVKFDTHQELYHYWTLKHLGNHWPKDVFRTRDLPRWWFYGSLCQTVWKVDFLREHDAKLPLIPNGEDLCLTATLFPFIERGFVVNRQFYNYQRGAPTSAVTRMQGDGGNALTLKLESLLDIYRGVYAKLDEGTRQKFTGRMMSDFCFDSTVSEKSRRWMKEKGVEAFEIAKLPDEPMINPDHRKHLQELLKKTFKHDSISPADNEIPPQIAKTMRGIEQERESSAKDLYIVTAQLGSLNDEAIDGWSFFQYLKERGVPAVFVSAKAHRRYREFKAEFPDSVIGLGDADPFKFEFVKKCRNELVRARAVVQEWPVGPDSFALWLKKLNGLAFVFMQHGVMYNPPRPVHMHYWMVNDIINFTSRQEQRGVMQAMLASDPAAAGIATPVCGLARYDLLKDEQDANDRILFIMFTFRPTFNTHPETFEHSAYFAALKRLLSEENIARLAKAGVRPVLCLHHGLVKNRHVVKELRHIAEIVPPDEVSKYIRKAACLITDFSSVSFDFWQLGKPVVYFIPDRYDQTLSVPDREKVYVAEDFLKKFTGLVYSAGDAIAAVERHAAFRFALNGETKAKIAGYTLSSLDGKCRERLYNAIEEHLGGGK